MTWLKWLIKMARKGILTLAGIASGGSVNVPPENPPGSVTPPPPPISTQNVTLGFLSDGQSVFAPGVTRELIASQATALNFVTSTQTIFQPQASIVSGLQNTSVPLVTVTPLALAPSASVTGQFLETFTGTNGVDWDATKWTNKRVTTAGLGDIQSNTGRLSTGTLGNYAGFAGYMTVLSYADFELSGDYIVQGANVVYPMIGFRSSASWSTTHGSALDSYWLELKRNELGTFLYKRNGNTPTLVGGNSNFSWGTGDTIHFRINVQGTVIRTRVWKNLEVENTSTWDMTLVDTSFASGRIYLAANGGPDNIADEVRFDNIVILGGAVGAPPPPPPPPPTTTSLTQLGVTWTAYRPSSAMNATLAAAHPTQAIHIIDFGPASDEVNPSPGVYNWTNLDASINQMMAAGPTKPMIILCRCPTWMRPAGSTSADIPPTDANLTNWVNLCKAVAARYTQVKYFSYWNEMKGYYNAVENHYDWVRYTTHYNAVWAGVKSVRPDSKIGGPYVILESGATGTTWSHGPTNVTFPGGSFDSRVLQTMTYFRDNAVGFDFLSCDGGMENQFPRGADGLVVPEYALPAGVDPHDQLEKLWGFWKWVRANIHPTCELFNFETYVQQPWYAPPRGRGWSKTQIEDLMIELGQKTLANVPNPNVTYLLWQAPQYPPQVVNGDDNFTYFNTENTSYKNKVVAFHNAQTPPPPATGTTWNVPAQGSLQAVADLAQPGDTIYVSGTVQAADGNPILRLVNRRNGNLGENPIQVIGNPGNLLRGGAGSSGIEGYGSNRGWLFQNLNVEISGGNNAGAGQPGNNYYGEIFYFDGGRTDFGGDGLGCTNIRIIGCTGRPIAGTGSIQRHGAAVWGGGTIEIGNCDFADCGWNDNGFFGGAASGISVGRSIVSNAPTLSNGARVWIHGNKIRNVKGPGTASADRNGIIMDIYHGWTSGPNAFWSNREHGVVIIEANDIANCEGRGVQLLCAGADDSQVIVRNNLIRAPIATNLGGSAPIAGIGGYGVGLCSNIVCSTNDVTVSAGANAYHFFDFNGGNGSGVTGTGNIGTPKVIENSPGNTLPPGF